MHIDVLDPRQKTLFDFLSAFADDYYLVGGTAIALQIAHRRSIDYDLFTEKTVQRLRIRNLFNKAGLPIEQVIYEEEGQLHILVNSVKLTFYQYPYTMEKEQQLPNGLYMPSLLSLAAMKTLALGGRAKWKDYVDLYFLLRDHFSLTQISMRAFALYQDSYNEKLLREQLCFFEDIDFSEEVDYLVSDPGVKAIQNFLTDVATTGWHNEKRENKSKD
jgi:hypothetical protein